MKLKPMNEFEYSPSIEDKIDMLQLSEERVDELQHMKLKEFPSINNYKTSNSEQIINVDNVVGVCRPMCADTWIEMLEDKYCHKNRNFELFNYDDFVDLLMNEPMDGLPEVLEYENEYYIAGNGLHRLTIAKCIGNMQAKVIVIKIHC